MTYSRVTCLIRVSRSRHTYGVAMMSRLLKIIGLFCKKALQKRTDSAKETYNIRCLLIKATPYYDKHPDMCATHILGYIHTCWVHTYWVIHTYIYVYMGHICGVARVCSETWMDGFLDGYCSTVQGLLDWFEVDLGFSEFLFRLICVLCVFLFFTPSCSHLVLFGHPTPPPPRSWRRWGSCIYTFIYIECTPTYTHTFILKYMHVEIQLIADRVALNLEIISKNF